MSGGAPVAVALDLPRLELDRPFTYRWPDDAPVTGAFVSVPFHGRTVKGWVLGPTDDVPARVLPIRRILSRVALFDDDELALYRWIRERYIAPLGTVIGRAHPPRVAGEESKAPGPPAAAPDVHPPDVIRRYDRGPELLAACRGGAGGFLVRPLPEEEGETCLEAVAACVAGGRTAVVVVPEAEPLPATATRIVEAFGAAALLLVGGTPRERYRAWLDALAGRYRVVVGTRPVVFAPAPSLGLVWVSREGHPAHREERAPYHHVREVALARARLRGAVAVLAAQSPGADAVTLADGGGLAVVRAPRRVERAAAPLVETVRPDHDELGGQLQRALRGSNGAFLLVSRRGYGVARVCRACGTPARCGVCDGAIEVAGGVARCGVCGAEGVCTSCGSRRFGVDPRGTEHVEERAASLTRLPVHRVDEAGEAAAPGAGRVVVGTVVAVKDVGGGRVPLVAILDADSARRRPGLTAPEQVLATWMEAAIWAGPKDGGGRVIVQTREPGDPMIQALVRWDPWHFHRHERARRAEAGFPPGHPVFRLLGTADLPGLLEQLQPRPTNLLSTTLGDETVSLVTLRPDAVPGFRAWVLDHHRAVTRVEADPQL